MPEGCHLCRGARHQSWKIVGKIAPKKNTLHHEHNHTQPTLSHPMSEQVILWISIPILLSSLFYCAVVLMTWPYARPLVPLWLLFLCILVPPFFPFLAFYLLFTIVYFSPVLTTTFGPREIVVVEASNRGRVTSAPVRSRSAPPSRPSRLPPHAVGGPRSYAVSARR